MIGRMLTEKAASVHTVSLILPVSALPHWVQAPGKNKENLWVPSTWSFDGGQKRDLDRSHFCSSFVRFANQQNMIAAEERLSMFSHQAMLLPAFHSAAKSQ